MKPGSSVHRVYNVRLGVQFGRVLAYLVPSRSLLPSSWANLPDGLREGDDSYLANEAALCLVATGEGAEALAAYGRVRSSYLGLER